MSSEGKYVIHATIRVDGTVARKDVVGAIFGQTEGLLGEGLQLRKLQRTGRIGHVDVNLNNHKGRVQGVIEVSSSIDQVSTAVIGAALETIDRIGPCKAVIKVKQIENIRSAKRDHVIDRAKQLLLDIVNSASGESKNILDEVKAVLTLDTEVEFEEMTAGPNVKNSDSIIIVEGRNDVRNLLKFGIKNAIATMGSGIKPELAALASKKKTVTAFLDGDRGGKLLLMEISGTLGKSLTHVAFAPQSREVEHLEGKVVTKCLGQKETATKAVARIQTEIQKDDDKAVGKGKASLEAPDEIKGWAPMMDGLKANHAVIVLSDGSGSDPVGAKALEAALGDSDGAQGLVFSGKVTDRIHELASGAGINVVVGKTVGAQSLKLGVQAYSVKDLE
ncbi:MAG: DNA primase [Candidatus Poseidoniales archaeon]|jgi:DNA primase|nr:MAG: DNA primase [Candidatus Poseidoniales archaeon]|tara:strand:+ start:542 stop:1711 length:1170 start_codon:yes stop_codon:yes gene_type:complete